MEEQPENRTVQPARSKLFSSKNLILILLAMIAPFCMIAIEWGLWNGKPVSERYLFNVLPEHWFVILSAWFLMLMGPSLILLSFLSAQKKEKAILLSLFVLFFTPLAAAAYIVVGVSIEQVYP